MAIIAAEEKIQFEAHPRRPFELDNWIICLATVLSSSQTAARQGLLLYVVIGTGGMLCCNTIARLLFEATNGLYFVSLLLGEQRSNVEIHNDGANQTGFQMLRRATPPSSAARGNLHNLTV